MCNNFDLAERETMNNSGNVDRPKLAVNPTSSLKGLFRSKNVEHLESEIELSNKEFNVIETSFGVVKRFEFSSALQRMSTISVSHSDNSFSAFVKGSPEMIHSLSVSESIPSTFFDVLEKYTQDGLRVLALAYKPLPDANATWVTGCRREDVEQELQFLGLLIMENKVKAETNLCLQKLQDARIGTVMATGDNGLTGIAVGRKCGIINPYRPVYFGELTKCMSGSPRIRWKKINNS